LLKEMTESSRTSLPDESPELARQFLAISSTLLKLQAWDEAERLIREALTIREKVEPDAWTTFNTKSMLGGALLGQKKSNEAETMLLAVNEGMQQREAAIPPQGKVRLPEALERLVQLYTDWHPAEPDQGYDTRAAEWQQKLDEHNAALSEEKPTMTNEK
jgi:hypothetical protein